MLAGRPAERSLAIANACGALDASSWRAWTPSRRWTRS
jgi:hypothetical protein